jgi:GINS complex subunit 2
VAKLVLGAAPEDVPYSEEIRTLIKDIWDMRLAKLRTVMDAYLKGEGVQTKLDHVTLMEVHSIRPFFPHMMDLISRLEKSVKIAGNQGNTTRN